MTYNEIIYDIRSMLEAHRSSDDSPLENEIIGFWVRVTRAALLKQHLNKGYSIDFNLIQDLGCQELETVDRAECCDIEIDCSVKRTKNEIPAFIELYHRMAMTRVGPIDKMKRPYSIVNERQVVFSGNGRFNTNEIFAYWKNNRVYIKGNDNHLAYQGLERINIQGVFEDPIAVREVTSCDGSPCYDDNKDYPLPMWMYEIMKKMIRESEYKLLHMTPVDITNDGTGTIYKGGQGNA